MCLCAESGPKTPNLVQKRLGPHLPGSSRCDKQFVAALGVVQLVGEVGVVRLWHSAHFVQDPEDSVIGALDQIDLNDNPPTLNTALSCSNSIQGSPKQGSLIRVRIHGLFTVSWLSWNSTCAQLMPSAL